MIHSWIVTWPGGRMFDAVYYFCNCCCNFFKNWHDLGISAYNHELTLKVLKATEFILLRPHIHTVRQLKHFWQVMSNFIVAGNSLNALCQIPFGLCVSLRTFFLNLLNDM